MNRFAKRFRVTAGICVLMNLISLVFPLSLRVQANYADIAWKPLDYIEGAFAGILPFLGEAGEKPGSGQAGWVLIFLILPLILSVAAAVWAMVGGYAQKGSSLLTFVILVIYIGMALTTDTLWPEAGEGQAYSRGLACFLPLAFSGVGACFAMAALAAAPKKMKDIDTDIPQVEEIRQEQVEAKYTMLHEVPPARERMSSGVPGRDTMLHEVPPARERMSSGVPGGDSIMKEEKQKPEQQPEPAHGVLEGLTGIYAGARISMADGEFLLLGRGTENHLVFEGQSGVSRLHCRIRWDEGRQRYIFHDYSSTGTYVNGSGDCLPQNLDIEIMPGTVIALGDGSNSFRLD